MHSRRPLPALLTFCAWPMLAGPPAPPAPAEQQVSAWSEAIQKGEWGKVFQIGSPYLNHKRFLKHPSTSRFIGFTWFAAYIQSSKKTIPFTALESIRHATRLIPDQIEVWYEYGAELNRQQQYLQAEKALRRYLKSRPSNTDGRYELAYALNGRHRSKEALPLLRTLHQETPDVPRVMQELGFALNALRRGKEAESILLQLVQLRPEDPGAWMELSQAYRLNDKWQEASEAIDTSHRLGLPEAQARVERDLIAKRQKGKWTTAVLK